MPVIGWVFLALAMALILGSLFMLRDSANTLRISPEKMEKVRKRQAELEALEKQERDQNQEP